MTDDDDTTLSPEESISDEISERVRSVLAAAESAATAIRHEAEQQVQSKRRAAEAERQRYLEDAKAEAEALLEERMKRISQLSDSLIEGAEAILMRIEGAQEVKRQLETMVHALADAAEKLAGESEHAHEAPRPRPVAVEDPEPATVTELRTPPKPEPKPVVVEVVPEEDDDVEVVDAVAVVDDEPEAAPEPESAAEHPSPVERLRKAVTPPAENGAKDEAAPPEQRGFDGDDMLAARLVALQMAVAGSERVEVEAHLRKTFALEEPGAILNDVFGAESKL
jgi:cell division septum initiation protein DivIVA